jgi:hypothetical protein
MPARKRRKAQFTLDRLGLGNGEVIVRYRQKWFEMYRRGDLSLNGLSQVAPQIARAVESDLRSGRDWRYGLPPGR